MVIGWDEWSVAVTNDHSSVVNGHSSVVNGHSSASDFADRVKSDSQY
jgi:hypothetical protein